MSVSSLTDEEFEDALQKALLGSGSESGSGPESGPES
jgi:hypothetical protein